MGMGKESLNILVAGYIVRGPLGGLVWHHFQYWYGLHEMGHNVLFIEDSEDYPACFHPLSGTFSTDPIYGIHFLKTLAEQFGLADSWAYYDAHRNSWLGQSSGDVLRFASNADLFINLSGMMPLRDYWLKIPKRIYLDTDPLYTQIRHLESANLKALVRAHNAFFTYAMNIGDATCSIPADGIQWQSTRQPVVCKLWAPQCQHQQAAWTTVMQWDSYKKLAYGGIVYGMKSDSFEPYFALPSMTSEQLVLAAGNPSLPAEKLISHGWQIHDPLKASLTPSDFVQFIHQSKGEWSIAKQGYVISRSGWFSDRSCCYMASGKPVVLQDTGFSKYIPVGDGVLAFSNVEECLSAFETINTDYGYHARKAREIVAGYFAHDNVLGQLIKLS